MNQVGCNAAKQEFAHAGCSCCSHNDHVRVSIFSNIKQHFNGRAMLFTCCSNSSSTVASPSAAMSEGYKVLKTSLGAARCGT